MFDCLPYDTTFYRATAKLGRCAKPIAARVARPRAGRLFHSMSRGRHVFHRLVCRAIAPVYRNEPCDQAVAESARSARIPRILAMDACPGH